MDGCEILPIVIAMANSHQILSSGWSLVHAGWNSDCTLKYRDYRLVLQIGVFIASRAFVDESNYYNYKKGIKYGAFIGTKMRHKKTFFDHNNVVQCSAVSSIPTI